MADRRWEDLFSLGTYKGLAGRLYELYTESLLILAGRTIAWLDIDFTLVVKTVGVGKPAIAAWNTDFEALQWAVNDNLASEFHEIMHGVKEGSTATVHVHWVTGVQDATQRSVKWEAKITQADFGTAFPAASTLSAEDIIPANTPINTHFLTSLGTVTVGKIGSHVKIRLKRIASTGTAPSVNPFCDMVQMHVQCDSVGSRSIQTK